MPIQHFYLVILLFMGVLNGCGGASPGGLPPLGVTASASIGAVGLEQRVLALQTSSLASECETRQFAQKLELARVLDQHLSDLGTVQSQLPRSIRFNYVPFGPVVAREYNQAEESTPPTGWVVEGLNWSELYDFYRRIMSQPINSDWLHLNRRVRYLLRMDEKRLLRGDPFFFDPDTKAWLGLLEESLLSCDLREDCFAPSYLQDYGIIPRNFAGNLSYQNYSVAIEAATDLAVKRNKIQLFHQEVALDYQDYFGFMINESVTRTNPTDIVVKMDVGAFSSVRDQLAQLIERKWTSTQLSVHIEWVDQTLLQTAFKFILGEGLGNNVYVSSYRRAVYLFQDLILNNIAHEFGHVLGFPDRYFQKWLSNACSYQESYRNDDIMSDSRYGTVTAEEWAELNQRYPYTSHSP